MELFGTVLSEDKELLLYVVILVIIVLILCGVWIYVWSGRVGSEGKAVLITGCDTGFGNLLAKRLLSLKYHVIALCLNDQSEGAKDLTSRGCDVIKCDVTKDDDVEKARQHVDKYLEESGDVLWSVVNNAGIAEISFVEWLPLSAYQKVMDVNVMGMIRVLHAFLPHVRKCSGRIVNVASMAGRFPIPTFSAYCMSKYSVVALSECLRMELRQFGVHVAIVQPVLYRTPMADSNAVTDVARQYWKHLPQHIRDDYGETYFETMFRLKKARTDLDTRHDLDEVIDGMTHAVTSLHPHRTYECHWTTWLLRLAIKFGPSCVAERITMMLGMTGKAATAKQ